MKKFILLSFILFSTLLLSGCSYSYGFFIANNSDGILEIEFRWNEDLYSAPYKFKFEKLKNKTFEKFEAVGSFTKEEIELAEKINTFRVSLEPKQALRIHSIDDNRSEKINASVDNFFRINFLRLKGKNGSIEITGDEVWFQFHEIDSNYFIIYK